MITPNDNAKDDDRAERIWRIVGRISVAVLLIGLLIGIAILVLMWKIR